jgi:cell division protein FtsN
MGKPKHSLADLTNAKSRNLAKKTPQSTTKAHKDIANAVETANEIKNVMVQVALVRSKTAAEAEYRRILHKNKALKGLGKKIVRVDLGEKKGVRYRIQIGPFKSKADAKKIIFALKDNGLSPYISK